MSETMIRPSQFIQQFERQLGFKPQRILDIGCHLGRNSLYLSRLGHNVVAVDSNVIDAQNAKLLARDHEIDNCRFVVADGRKLPFRQGAFTTVIANEILHMMPKDESRAVLNSARNLTAAGGLNAVSGYFVGSETFADNKEKYLAPNELAVSYEQAGWHIIDYREQTPRGEMINDQFYVQSLATNIARKPYS
jgi:SAM-dependent methyltransferase